jgi:hypothetical protein
VVADAFSGACASHAEPKSRAVALKLKLRELSRDARFSFALLDLATSRAFAASTALSSPLAIGHTAAGTPPHICHRSSENCLDPWLLVFVIFCLLGRVNSYSTTENEAPPPE